MSEAKCPRCGSKKHEYVSLFGNFDLGCCLECGYVFEVPSNVAKKDVVEFKGIVDVIIWLFAIALTVLAIRNILYN